MDSGEWLDKTSSAAVPAASSLEAGYMVGTTHASRGVFPGHNGEPETTRLTALTKCKPPWRLTNFPI